MIDWKYQRFLDAAKERLKNTELGRIMRGGVPGRKIFHAVGSPADHNTVYITHKHTQHNEWIKKFSIQLKAILSLKLSYEVIKR
jgi:hypothetical protein